MSDHSAGAVHGGWKNHQSRVRLHDVEEVYFKIRGAAAGDVRDGSQVRTAGDARGRPPRQSTSFRRRAAAGAELPPDADALDLLAPGGSSSRAGWSEPESAPADGGDGLW